MGTSVQIDGEAVMQVLVGQVEAEGVIDPEINSEGGFGVALQQVAAGGAIDLLNGEPLMEPDVFEMSEAVVGELEVDWGLVLELEVPAALEHSESGIIIFMGEIEWYNFLMLADAELVNDISLCQYRMQVAEIVLYEGSVVDIVVLLEGNVSHLDQRLNQR